MADETDHEIIILSSDDESKPKVDMLASKKQKVIVNYSTVKRNQQNFKSLPQTLQTVKASNTNVSKTYASFNSRTRQPIQNTNFRTNAQKVFVGNKSAVNFQTHQSLNNFKQTTQINSKPVNNFYTNSKSFNSASHQSWKNVQSNNLISSQKYGNNKTFAGKQVIGRSNMVASSVLGSQSNFLPKTYTRAPNNALRATSVQNSSGYVSSQNIQALKSNVRNVMQVPSTSGSRTISLNPTSQLTDKVKNNNKNVVPFSVLNALQKKGISVTNVTETVSTTKSGASQNLQTQRYLNKLKSSLKGSGTSIVTVPERKNVIAPNGNHISQINSKRKFEANTFNIQNKRLCQRNAVNISLKSKYDVPFKTASQVNVSKTNPIATNSTSFNSTARRTSLPQNNSMLIKNNIVKSGISKAIPGKPLHFSKSPVTDTVSQISSRKSLTITPIQQSKPASVQLPIPSTLQPRNEMKRVQHTKSKNDITVNTSTFLSSNPSLSITPVESVKKNPSNKNENINSPVLKIVAPKNSGSKNILTSTVIEKKTPSLQGSINSQPDIIVCKNIDLSTDRDTLLNIVSSCSSENKSKPSINETKLHKTFDTSTDDVSESEPIILSVSTVDNSVFISDTKDKTHVSCASINEANLHKKVDTPVNDLSRSVIALDYPVSLWNKAISNSESIKPALCAKMKSFTLHDAIREVANWPKLMVQLQRIDAELTPSISMTQKLSNLHKPVNEEVSLSKVKDELITEHGAVENVGENVSKSENTQLKSKDLVILLKMCDPPDKISMNIMEQPFDKLLIADKSSDSIPPGNEICSASLKFCATKENDDMNSNINVSTLTQNGENRVINDVTDCENLSPKMDNHNSKLKDLNSDPNLESSSQISQIDKNDLVSSIEATENAASIKESNIDIDSENSEDIFISKICKAILGSNELNDSSSSQNDCVFPPEKLPKGLTINSINDSKTDHTISKESSGKTSEKTSSSKIKGDNPNSSNSSDCVFPPEKLPKGLTINSLKDAKTNHYISKEISENILEKSVIKKPKADSSSSQKSRDCVFPPDKLPKGLTVKSLNDAQKDHTISKQISEKIPEKTDGNKLKRNFSSSQNSNDCAFLLEKLSKGLTVNALKDTVTEHTISKKNSAKTLEKTVSNKVKVDSLNSQNSSDCVFLLEKLPKCLTVNSLKDTKTDHTILKEVSKKTEKTDCVFLPEKLSKDLTISSLKDTEIDHAIPKEISENTSEKTVGNKLKTGSSSSQNTRDCVFLPEKLSKGLIVNSLKDTKTDHTISKEISENISEKTVSNKMKVNSSSSQNSSDCVFPLEKLSEGLAISSLKDTNADYTISKEISEKTSENTVSNKLKVDSSNSQNNNDCILSTKKLPYGLTINSLKDIKIDHAISKEISENTSENIFNNKLKVDSSSDQNSKDCVFLLEKLPKDLTVNSLKDNKTDHTISKENFENTPDKTVSNKVMKVDSSSSQNTSDCVFLPEKLSKDLIVNSLKDTETDNTISKDISENTSEKTVSNKLTVDISSSQNFSDCVLPSEKLPKGLTTNSLNNAKTNYSISTELFEKTPEKPSSNKVKFGCSSSQCLFPSEILPLGFTINSLNNAKSDYAVSKEIYDNASEKTFDNILDSSSQNAGDCVFPFEKVSKTLTINSLNDAKTDHSPTDISENTAVEINVIGITQPENETIENILKDIVSGIQNNSIYPLEFYNKTSVRVENDINHAVENSSGPSITSDESSTETSSVKQIDPIVQRDINCSSSISMSFIKIDIDTDEVETPHLSDNSENEDDPKYLKTCKKSLNLETSNNSVLPYVEEAVDSFLFPQDTLKISEEKFNETSSNHVLNNEKNSFKDISAMSILNFTNILDKKSTSIEHTIKICVTDMLSELEYIIPNETATKNEFHTVINNSNLYNTGLVYDTAIFNHENSSSDAFGEKHSTTETVLNSQIINSSEVRQDMISACKESHLNKIEVEVPDEVSKCGMETFSTDAFLEDVSNKSDDESRSNLSKYEVSAEQITSPKLSLKRNRNEVTPDDKMHKVETNGHSFRNEHKRRRLDPVMQLDEEPCSVQGEPSTSYASQISIPIPDEVYSMQVGPSTSYSSRTSNPIPDEEPYSMQVVLSTPCASQTFNSIPDEESCSIQVESSTSYASPASNSVPDEDNREKYVKLLEFSRPLMGCSEIEKSKILRNMKRKLDGTEPSYINSRKFSALLNSIRNKINKKPGETLIFINDIRKEMKHFRCKSKDLSNKESGEDSNFGPSSVTSKNVDEREVDIFHVTATSKSRYSFNKESGEDSNFGQSSVKSINNDLSIDPLTLISKSKDLSNKESGEDFNVASSSVKSRHSDEKQVSICPFALTPKYKDLSNKECEEDSNFASVNPRKVDIFPADSTSRSKESSLEAANSSILKDNVDSKNKFALCSTSSAFSLSTYETAESAVPYYDIQDNEDHELCLDTSPSLPGFVTESNHSISEDVLIGKGKHSFTSVASDTAESFSCDKTVKEDTYNSFNVPSTSKQNLPISDIATSSKAHGSLSTSNTQINRASPKMLPSVSKGSPDQSNLYKDPFFAKASTSVSQSKINDALSKLNGAASRNENSSAKQDSRHEARIRKLENWLSQLDRKIKKLQTRELSLDDLDCKESAYVREEAYLKRFIKIWKELCKLQKQSSRTGRVIEKKFSFKGSRYSSINEAVQKLINKRKVEEKFPHYLEILQIIKNVNELKDIGLTERDIEAEAQRVFRDVGRELQSRRARDNEDLFGCYLTDNFNPNEDPAEHDEELKKVLDNSVQKFESSISEIIDHYAEKQKTANEGSEDDESEDKESADEEEVAAFDNDNDLPLTDAFSPTESIASRKNDSSDDIIEIANESEKSTEPNDDVDNYDIFDQNYSSESAVPKHLFSSEMTVIDDSVVVEDSDSEDDLPSIIDLVHR